MRWVAFVILAACGEPQHPALANAPHPDPAAVAGVAAGAAAAMTLADPNAATRGKPEKSGPEKEKQPVEVKEQVPAAVLDHLDDKQATHKPEAKPAEAKRKGPLPKIPSPKDAAEHEEKEK